MTQTKIAIIQFPGTNSEYDTQRAAEATGIQGDIVRWTADPNSLSDYDGYVLPGGFSYQDRVRAGAIAAKLPVLNFLEEANQAGKPILGICNGCQILAETGLIPDLSGNATLEVALAHNYQNNAPIGFRAEWVYVNVKRPEKSLYSIDLPTNIGLPVAISHGEGRFVMSEETRAQLSDCTVYNYCNADGSDDAANPNGSIDNIAGICNPKGNVMAIMPHPERSFFTKQLPSWMDNQWSNAKQQKTSTSEFGPWLHLFEAMKRHMENSK